MFITELFDSGAQTVALAPEEQGITLKYIVEEAPIGVGEDLAVRSLVQATIPAFSAGLRFNNYQLENLGLGNWLVDAHYGLKSGGSGGAGNTVGGSKPAGTKTLTFNTGSVSTKRTQAFAQTRFPAPGVTVTDYKGAIGIRSEGGKVKAEGIDVEAQSFEFTISITFDATAPLTGTQVGLLIALAWHVNSDQIDVTILGVDLHFAPGELLFKGATGSHKSGGTPISEGATFEGEVKLDFACQLNLTNVTLPGSEIPGVTKQGWDYLEIIYEEEVRNNKFAPKAIQANVNQVYPRAALAVLFV